MIPYARLVKWEATFSGNQLSALRDDAPTVLLEASLDLPEGAWSGSDFKYDANGNQTRDMSRGVSDVSYNVLNLPQRPKKKARQSWRARVGLGACGGSETVSGPVHVAHVACVLEGAVECQRCFHSDVRLARFAQCEIVAQQRTVHRVSAVLDHDFCTLYRIKAAKVGNTLVSDDHVDRVLRMVNVSHLRHDVAYQAAFGD